MTFPADQFFLPNARARSPYTATLRGLASGGFTKVEGPGWLSVAADGAVTGTPPASASARTTTFTVRAGNATATVKVRVRPPGGALVPEPRVMSWNLWLGGTQVRDARRKQLKVLLDADVDVVGLQETAGSAARELAEALGWHYVQGGSTGIVSRHPIVAASEAERWVHARVRFDNTHELSVWNAHLGYTPYGPYEARFGRLPHEEIMAKEAESGRTGQMTALLASLGDDPGPLVLTGDFNAPSHLDWPDVAWPTSTLAERAGLRDSFRVAHPDPADTPGITWSPISPVFTGGYGYDEHAGAPEPQDRIDYVLFRGDLRVRSSEVVATGEPRPIPDHQDNDWPSDHAAVLTTFSA